MRSLAKISSERRAVFFLATKIANELLLLQRLTIVHENGFTTSTSDETERDCQNAMLFMALVLLAGKTFEAHKSLSSFGRLWRQGGEIELDEEGYRAKAELDCALANGSPLSAIRNKIAFHFDSEVLARQFDAEDHSGDYQFIASTDYTNTLFLSTEALSAFSALSQIEADKQSAMDKFYNLTADAAGNAMNFSTAVALAALGDNHDIEQVGLEIEIRGRPNLDEVRMPFLVQPPIQR